MAEERVLAGRYEIESVIGRGGMAQVYLGTDRVLGRQVAVKVLGRQFAQDSSFVTRFRREAQSAAALNHPNVVSVFDTGSDDGIHFIVMEYVQGKTLAEAIREDAPFLPERAVEIAVSVSEALAFAHRNGIVHRDVKPGNIMLTPKGDVKVMDFGIARATASESLTQTATVLGTATYFSPEQAQGETVDARSDIYSLGVVLYEMLTGQPPFSGESAVSVAYKHVREDPVPPSRLNRDVSTALDAIVLKCLAKNPANRYQTVEELLRDLGRYRSGLPVAATPVLPPDRTEHIERAPRSTSVLPAPTTPEIERGRRWVAVALVVGILAIIAVGLFFLAQSLLDSGNGGGTVTVPNVIGKTVEEATAELEGAGFEVNPTLVEAPSDQFEAGLVTDYDPKEAPEGAEITLTVSTGPETVTIPEVTCQGQRGARRALEELGLVVEVSEERRRNPDCDRANSVAETEPAVGEDIAVGETVTLFLTPPELAAPSAPDLAAGSDSGSSNSDNVTNETALTFSGTAEPGLRVVLFRDGAEVDNTIASNSGGWTLTDSGPVDPGTHTYTARASNEEGDTSEDSEPLDVVVDTNGPTVTITSMPDDPTTETQATFEFEASQQGATFFCELDGPLSTSEECNSPKTYTGLSPGTYTFSVTATDLAGNTGPTETFTWTVEVESPPSPSPSPSV